jgi:tetratricopeptide (TPR) repeat protein
MKTFSIILLIIILSLGASFLFTRVMESPTRGGDFATLESRMDQLGEDVDKLLAADRELAEMVKNLGAAAAAEGQSMREPVMSIQEAVDLWIRENRPDMLEPGASKASAGDEDFEALPPRQQAAQLLAKLNDPDMDDEGWNRVWKEINDAGLTDEAIALLEENVARDPTNPDAHVALAGGYLGKTMNTANDMEKGLYAMKADKVLDDALELDAWHWDARFTKAVSLTFYPPVMGKQGEAIKHFEILLDQQKGQPARPGFSQTYLYLGNLHQQMGDHDKASQIWKEGLTLFPDDGELAKQLDNVPKD